MPTIILLPALHFPTYLSLFLLLLFLFFFISCVFLPIFSILLHSPLFCLYCAYLRPFFYIAYNDGFLLFCPLTAFSQYKCPSQMTHRSVGCPAITTYLCQPCHISFLDKRVSFCFLAHRGIPIRIRVSILSYYPLWHALSDSSSSSFFWVVCHPNRTFPLKVLEQESQNSLSLSPHRQTIPSLTSDPWLTNPILAGYKWVVFEPCACSTSMCVLGLSVIHAFAMT